MRRKFSAIGLVITGPIMTLALLFQLISAMPAAAEPVQPTSDGTLHGVVTRQSDGTPIAGASVDLWFPNCAYRAGHTTTDAEGKYTYTNLDADPYKILFEANGYASEWYDRQVACTAADSISVQNGQTGEANAALEAQGIIQGIVTAQDNGQIIAGSVVAMYEAGSNRFVNRTTTDDAGVYVLDGITNGTYKVSFTAPDYASEWYTDRRGLEDANLITVTASTTSTLDAALAPQGMISGTVIGEDSGLPLAGVLVMAYYADTGLPASWGFSDNDGQYTIQHLIAASYQLEFWPTAGYAGEWYQDKSAQSSSDPISINAGQAVVIDASLAPCGTVIGRVTAEDSGQPLGGVTVRAFPMDSNQPEVSDVTNADGKYRLGNLLPTPYVLQFESTERYLGEWYENQRSKYSASSITPTAGVTYTINAALKRGGVIAGRVTADDTGVGLTNVTIRVVSPDSLNLQAIATSDADGYFNASTYFGKANLYGGVYYLEIRPSSSSGYLPEYYDNYLWPTGDFTPILVTASMTTTSINATLKRGYFITGSVTGGGLPLAGVSVEVHKATNEIAASGLTATDGQYRAGPLDSGLYWIYFKGKDGFAGEWYTDSTAMIQATPLVVTGTDVTGIDADLAAGSHIQGLVSQVDNSPLSNVGVEVYPAGSDEAIADATSADDGTFTVDPPVPPGVYQVHFSHPDYAGQWYNNQPAQQASDIFTVTTGVTITNLDARLIPINASSTIAGKISAADSVAPLQTWIQALDRKGIIVSEQYAIQGEYMLQLEPGIYRLRIQKAPAPYVGTTYFSNTTVFSITYLLKDAVPITTTGGVSETINFRVPRGGAISGRVTSSGQPLAGVLVKAESTSVDDSAVISTFTGSDGRYRIEQLPPGAYFVNFLPGAPFNSQSYHSLSDPTQSNTLNVDVNETLQDINADLLPGGTIAGSVTAADTGLPLRSATVEIFSLTGTRLQTLKTDMDGAYQSSGLPAGEYLVFFRSLIGYANQWYQDDDSSDEAAPVSVPASGVIEGIDAALAPGGSISGVVLDQRTGLPIPGAEILVDGVFNVLSNSWGYYRTEGLPGGTYTLTATHDAYASSSAPQLKVSPGTNTPNVSIYLTQPVTPPMPLYLPGLVREH